MSHFTMLVVGDKDLDEVMLPYKEHDGDVPKEYLEFEDHEDEYLKRYETESVERYKSPEGELFYPWNDKFKVENRKPGENSHKKPDDYESVQVPFKELYPTFETFMADWCGEKNRDEEKNRFGYWHNPNGFWDWYQVGGRWAGFFKLKEGATGEQGTPSWMTRVRGESYPEGRVDRALKGDIDFDGMYAENRKNAEEAWAKYEAECAEKGSENVEGYWSYNIRKGETKEQYIARNSAFTTFGVLMDGKWYQKGKMGWWAAVHDEKDPDIWEREFKALLEKVPDDTLLTVIDCHT